MIAINEYPEAMNLKESRIGYMGEFGEGTIKREL